MGSTPDTTEHVDHDESPEQLRRELDWHREQLSIALDTLRAGYAAMLHANDNLEHGIGRQPGGSDPLRIAEASDQLRALLALPTDRPGSWEASHVEALDGELRGVLAALTGGAGAQ